MQDLIKKIRQIVDNEDVRQDILLYLIENDLSIEAVNITELKRSFNKKYFSYKEINFIDFAPKTEGDFINDVLLVDREIEDNLLEENNHSEESVNYYDTDISLNENILQKLLEKYCDELENKKFFLEYTEASVICRALNIKSGKDYKKRKKEGLLPRILPALPNDYYTNNGNIWKDWNHFLKHGYIVYSHNYYKRYATFEKWVHKNLLPIGVNNYQKWEKFKKNDLEVRIPSFIPRNPAQVYFNKGWVSWQHLFKTQNLSFSARKGNYIPYEQAKKWIFENLTTIGIDNCPKWEDFCRGDKKYFSDKNGNSIKYPILPENIPKSPSIIYKKTNEWISWGDWFGTEALSNRNRTFWTYEQTKKWVEQNIEIQMNSLIWNEWSKGNLPDLPKRPSYIPSSPKDTFRGKGWNGWREFLIKRN